MSEQYDRCDIVADRYFVGSLKEGTREKRGNDGSTINFTGNSVSPSNFKDFLSNSRIKDALSEFLAEKFLNIHRSSTSSTTLVVTFKNTILTNKNDLLCQPDISNCTTEEAAPRLIRHAINLARNGFEDITIRTVDSDVVVLSLACVHHMESGTNNIFT